MATSAFVSFRLGSTDGVSVVADTWMRTFRELGHEVRTVAGEGRADVVLPWLAIEGRSRPAPGELEAALAEADLVVVENLLTIPLNLPASRAVADVLRGRPALLHHHDPPWQRPRFAHVTELPVDDPSWRHVTINHLTARELAERGIEATVIYNGFDLDPRPTDRAATRAALGVEAGEVLLVHPVRAIERKNVPGALGLAEAIGATYWLPGPAEEGYGPTLEALLAAARTRVLRHPVAAAGMGDAYAASDAVLFPSTWEGFGNPPIEAAAHHRPVVVGHYPVAEELRRLGFCWLDPEDPAALAEAVAHPDAEILTRNLAVARAHFSLDHLRVRVAELLHDAGWAS